KQGGSGKLADAGHQLDWPDKAKTVRATGVTDGPFMEAKEVLGGYSLLETDTIDEAVEIAKTWPGIDRGWSTIEVRPVMVQDGRSPHSDRRRASSSRSAGLAASASARSFAERACSSRPRSWSSSARTA